MADVTTHFHVTHVTCYVITRAMFVLSCLFKPSSVAISSQHCDSNSVTMSIISCHIPLAFEKLYFTRINNQVAKQAEK